MRKNHIGLLALSLLICAGAYAVEQSKYIGNLKFLGNTISSTNTNGNIILDPNGTGKIKFPDIVSHVLTVDGSGYVTGVSSAPAGDFVGTTDVQGLTNKITENLNNQGYLLVGGSGAAGQREVRFFDDSSDYVALKAPEFTLATYTLTLPAAAPTDNGRVISFAADGTGTFVTGQTAWTAYTPTFTGFGTVTNINVRSRRNGGSLDVMGSFTSGTSTAVEARITLGYAGTNSNVTSASWFSSTAIVGMGAYSVAGATVPTILEEASVGYLTIGIQGASNAGLTKANGSVIISTGNSLRFTASIPINGW